jgi:hypothetical protein
MMEVALAALLFVVMFAALVAVIVSGWLLHGWVLSILWGWFLVPLEIPAISVPAAMGISLIVGAMAHQHTPKDFFAKSDTKECLWYLALKSWAAPFLTLGIGLCVKQFL